MAVSGVYSRANWLNFEHTMKLPSALRLSLYTSYQWQSWTVAFTVENLTDETYFLGADHTFRIQYLGHQR